MKNTIKALSKQFFGAKYESARKSLLAAVIKGEHKHPQHRFHVPPPGKQLPHDTGGKKG